MKERKSIINNSNVITHTVHSKESTIGNFTMHWSRKIFPLDLINLSINTDWNLAISLIFYSNVKMLLKVIHFYLCIDLYFRKFFIPTFVRLFHETCTRNRERYNCKSYDCHAVQRLMLLNLTTEQCETIAELPLPIWYVETFKMTIQRRQWV